MIAYAESNQNEYYITSTEGFNIKFKTLLGYNGSETDLVIPDGVTKINDAAFYENTGINSVTFPDGLLKIGNSSFMGCTLEEINIPDSVTEIGTDAIDPATTIVTNPGSAAMTWAIANQHPLYLIGEGEYNFVLDGSLTISGSGTVLQGQTVTLQAEFTQEQQPTNKKVTWKSSNTKVATVTDAGVVKGIGGGTVTITACSSERETICAPFSMKVIPLATKVTITDKDNKTKKIDIGTTGQSKQKLTYKLAASVTPSTAGQTVTWKSSNTGVATVSESGVVTGKKVGTATITATAGDNSGVKATFTISVVSKVQSGSLKMTGDSTVVAGKTLTLKSSFSQQVQPTNKNVTWTSSSTAVAKVSSSGVVTGVKAGTATIKVCSKETTSICASKKITVKPKATGIKITDKDNGKKLIDLGTTGTSGQKLTYKLAAPVTPSGAVQTVTWKSSNTKVAKVSSSGVVTGVKNGTATITATTTDGTKKSASVKITVVTKVQKGSLTLSGTTTIAVGKSATLKAAFNQSVQPTNKAVTWTTSNKKVATVSTSGVVKGIKAGTATIKACSKDNTSVCKSVKVTVKAAATKVTVSGTSSFDIGAGPATATLKAVVSPSGANQAVTWSSSNTAVAAVSDKGVVKVQKAGTATITATTKDGTKKAGTIKITAVSGVQPDSLSVSGDSTVIIGKTITLTHAFTQAVAPSNENVIWISSNAEIATVNAADGVVTGVSAGTVKIEACSEENTSVCAGMDITVIEDPDLESSAETENPLLGATPIRESKPHFAESELTILIGDAKTVQVINPKDDAFVVMLGGDVESAAWDESTMTITGITEGEVIAYLSLVDPVDVIGTCSIHIVTGMPDSTADPVEGPEATPGPEETEGPEGSGPRFVQDENTIEIGKALKLEIINPENKAVIVMLEGDMGSVIWDEGSMTIAGVSEGVVTAYLSLMDQVEVIDTCVIHIVTEIVTPEPTVDPTADPVEGPEATPGPEETERPEGSGPRFVQDENTIEIGKALKLEIINPENKAVIVMLDGDMGSVMWDEGSMTIAGVSEGVVTAYLSLMDQVDVIDTCVIRIVTEIVTPEPTVDPTADPVEGPTVDPMADPGDGPTVDPTADPGEEPTVDPTDDPGEEPTVDPRDDPGDGPTVDPTADPAEELTVDPTDDPAEELTVDPTDDPADGPDEDLDDEPEEEPEEMALYIGEKLTVAELMELEPEEFEKVTYEIEFEGSSAVVKWDRDEDYLEGLKEGDVILILKAGDPLDEIGRWKFIVENEPEEESEENPDDEPDEEPTEEITETAVPEPAIESTSGPDNENSENQTGYSVEENDEEPDGNGVVGSGTDPADNPETGMDGNLADDSDDPEENDGAGSSEGSDEDPA